MIWIKEYIANILRLNEIFRRSIFLKKIKTGLPKSRGFLGKRKRNETDETFLLREVEKSEIFFDDLRGLLKNCVVCCVLRIAYQIGKRGNHL